MPWWPPIVSWEDRTRPGPGSIMGRMCSGDFWLSNSPISGSRESLGYCPWVQTAVALIYLVISFLPRSTQHFPQLYVVYIGFYSCVFRVFLVPRYKGSTPILWFSSEMSVVLGKCRLKGFMLFSGLSGVFESFNSMSVIWQEFDKGFKVFHGFHMVWGNSEKILSGFERLYWNFAAAP